MKYFESESGAHKYAENASRKYAEDRYVIKTRNGWYVSHDNDIDEWERIIAHYKDGIKL